jgi:hypothetical protein
VQEVSDNNTYSTKFTLSPLPAMYLIVSKDLSESFSLTLKPGISFRPITGTFELGLALNYKICDDKFFLLGGLNMYFVKEESQGSHFETYSKTIYFILLGVGYQLNDRISVDVCFHQALNNEFGYTYAAFPSEASGPSKLYNMLKLGLTASF